MKKVLSFALTCAILSIAGAVSAHPHIVNKGTANEVTIANGQNHAGFKLQPDGTDGTDGTYCSYDKSKDYPHQTSCDTSLEYLQPSNMGPAGYGLETAHHGPDQGSPGKSDGSFVSLYSPTSPEADNNPAID